MSGIFRGNILGLAGPGLGKLDIPHWCWDTTGFKDAHAVCWEMETEPAKRDQCVKEVIDLVCPWSKPPVPANVTVTGYKKGDKCTSENVVKYVQSVIGTSPDGVWGTKSEAALKKFGKSFKEIALDCDGNAPSVKTGSSYTPTPTVPPPAAKVEPKTPGSSFNQAGFMGLPTIAWVGVAGVAAVLILIASKKKDARSNSGEDESEKRRKEEAREAERRYQRDRDIDAFFGVDCLAAHYHKGMARREDEYKDRKKDAKPNAGRGFFVVEKKSGRVKRWAGPLSKARAKSVVKKQKALAKHWCEVGCRKDEASFSVVSRKPAKGSRLNWR